ncbi:MAG: hypothetical protein HYU66_13210, partial [Armatimonadetes bacterium]|nr:hypothetical protein [Armatimonadota bacterium]
MYVCTLLPLLTVSADLQSPAELPGLALWLDAADPGALAFDGARVREWRDKSGRGRHLAAPTEAARPELVKGGRNGHDLVAFDGATHWLSGPPVLPAGQAAYTIAAVWHPARNQGAQS